MKKEKHENQNLSDKTKILTKLKLINLFKYLVYFLDRILCIFIKKPKKDLNAKKQVLILANLGLGDAMNFLSVAEKYRKAYPKDKYEITLYVSNHLDELMKKETDFDNVELVPFNQIVTDIKKRINLIKKIRKTYYTAVIDIMGVTGCTPSMYLMASAVAEEKISIINKAYSICPKFFYKRIYTKLIEINNKKITNIEYYHYLANELFNIKDDTIKFHKIKEIDLKIDLPKEYYIVYPSASLDKKKWEYEKYAELIEKIYVKTKLPVVFCGTNSDIKDVEEVTKNIKTAKYINILGKTSVLEFIEVIRRAKFVITNDTGAYHIALGLEVPVSIITGGYTYDRFVTYNFKNNPYKKPYIITNKRECFNCNSNCKYLEKGQEKWPCLQAVTVDYAWKIVEKMIDDIKE